MTLDLTGWRQFRYLNRATLARRAGVSVSTVARFEQGATPRQETAERLARALEVPVAMLTEPFDVARALGVDLIAAIEALEQVRQRIEVDGAASMEDVLSALDPDDVNVGILDDVVPDLEAFVTHLRKVLVREMVRQMAPASREHLPAQGIAELLELDP